MKSFKSLPKSNLDNKKFDDGILLEVNIRVGASAR